MGIIRDITLFINEFFLGYILVYGSVLFLSLIAGVIGMHQKSIRRKYKNEINHDYYIPVSIIVPAWNEEVTILDSINSLSKLKYKIYEIIIVNDGSTDKTLEKLINKYKMVRIKKPNTSIIKTAKIRGYYKTTTTKLDIILIDKENGGKADALNAGINAARYSYFLSIDADSVLQNDSLENIVRPVMEDNHTIAVGGLIRLSNGIKIRNGRIVEQELPDRFITKIQSLEYDRTFLSSRLMFDLFNGNLIISGAFGLFKTQAVINVGGYSPNTIGEDMELVIKLHKYYRINKIEYKIKYATDALCYTQVPEKMADLKKQRKRWHIGLFQSLTKHNDMLFNFKYGLLGIVSFPYYWIYELFAPLIEFVGLTFIFISYFIGLINLKFMIIYYLIYVLFCTMFSIASFFSRVYTKNNSIKFKEAVVIFLVNFLENFGFRQLVNIYRLQAFFNYRKNRQWQNLKRVEMDSTDE